jgi:hypothetical protein
MFQGEGGRGSTIWWLDHLNISLEQGWDKIFMQEGKHKLLLQREAQGEGGRGF